MSSVNVHNVLDEQEALITVSVLKAEGERDGRPVVVTVGIPEKQVVIRAGKFSEITRLIDDAWNAYTEFQVETAVPDTNSNDVLDEAPATAPEQQLEFYNDDAF
ncbi:MAG: hypothetical protein KC441_05450 [Anaerolineales bacterium]|nr:hypothetical protein [Anaerolineales bacterium]